MHRSCPGGFVVHPKTDCGRVADAIERLAAHLRQMAAKPDSMWWVLLCGQSLDTDDFAQREAAREALAQAAGALGVKLAEHAWVWDETGQAQLVVGTYSNQALAKKAARPLEKAASAMGLAVRVVKVWPKGSPGA